MTSPFAAEKLLASPGSTPRREHRWRSVEAALDRLSERLNPILVKEARQALKSRQFLITFTLLLLCGWGWSVLGIALLSPAIYYAPGGRFMMIGYYLVLAAPVLVIVPFSAFRSLAAEREDGTFELLSITSLSARQIITGKLGSAVLQMLVYFSALAPCIVFTYLLRGIDIVTILFVLVYTFLSSLLLSAAGLVVATASRARHWQVLLSVLLLIGLLFVGICWSISVVQMITFAGSMPFDDVDFWMANLAVVMFLVSFIVLAVLTAASLISFASDNRSTKLRVAMLGQQVLWIGWLTYAWMRIEAEEMLIVMMVFPAIYWAAMGALMSGEYAQLSPRVLRSLPRSLLGRMLFTWFNPGSGTGYTFAIGSLISVSLTVLILGFCGQLVALPGAPRGAASAAFAITSVSYVAAYLGLGRLIVLVMRQFAPIGMLFPVLIQAFLAFVGCTLPVLIAAWWAGYARLEYSELQFSNWFWTLMEIADDNPMAITNAPFLVALAGGVIFVANLLFAMIEVDHVRQETPQRVVEDERQLHPEKFAQPTAKKSPWDDEEPVDVKPVDVKPGPGA